MKITFLTLQTPLWRCGETTGVCSSPAAGVEHRRFGGGRQSGEISGLSSELFPAILFPNCSQEHLGCLASALLFPSCGCEPARW
ncbi:hypothetical protein BJX70DRAFT_63742 [Aspergillus crustosus]